LLIAPNLLNRNFTVAAPNRAWTGDITYTPTNQGWLFLAVVIDLFSRRVVGWSMQSQMHSNLVIDALEMAGFRCSPDRNAGQIFHRDRGSRYASYEFGIQLEQCGISALMSRKGNCWDNAPSETLFASLKVERLHGQRFETIRQVKECSDTQREVGPLTPPPTVVSASGVQPYGQTSPTMTSHLVGYQSHLMGYRISSYGVPISPYAYTHSY
jgi:transposase InsO family protein